MGLIETQTQTLRGEIASHRKSRRYPLFCVYTLQQVYAYIFTLGFLTVFVTKLTVSHLLIHLFPSILFRVCFAPQDKLGRLELVLSFSLTKIFLVRDTTISLFSVSSTSTRTQ